MLGRCGLLRCHEWRLWSRFSPWQCASKPTVNRRYFAEQMKLDAMFTSPEPLYLGQFG
jgi:hypothetical protein